MPAACPFDTLPFSGRIPPTPPTRTTFGAPNGDGDSFFVRFTDFLRRWIRLAKDSPLEDAPIFLDRLRSFQSALREERDAAYMLADQELLPPIMLAEYGSWGLGSFDRVTDVDTTIDELEAALADLEIEIRGRIFVMNALQESSNMPDDGGIDQSDPGT